MYTIKKLSPNKDNIKNYVNRQNISRKIGGDLSKTLLIIDATGPMSGLLCQVKSTVTTMFDRTKTILKENYID